MSTDRNQHYDVPRILVGGGNGQLKGNRMLHYERKPITTGNLLASVLNMSGIDAEKQGDGSGPLRQAT
jgi:hypothetical protein